MRNRLNAVKSVANELNGKEVPLPGRGRLLFGVRLRHSVVPFGYDRNNDENSISASRGLRTIQLTPARAFKKVAVKSEHRPCNYY